MYPTVAYVPCLYPTRARMYLQATCISYIYAIPAPNSRFDDFRVSVPTTARHRLSPSQFNRVCTDMRPRSEDDGIRLSSLPLLPLILRRPSRAVCAHRTVRSGPGCRGGGGARCRCCEGVAVTGMYGGSELKDRDRRALEDAARNIQVSDGGKRGEENGKHPSHAGSMLALVRLPACVRVERMCVRVRNMCVDELQPRGLSMCLSGDV
ncbi:hypothetical protein GGS23DRAFT_545756 [Durotheca rogersii]|uniref:uncharacterized protein n=1 Tax=Durotheca rogersii TaxID=419775 RepID=UPI00221F4CB9|nr:uncharacterized protein GGS23DRAFT_545756 [Durotheca rogersii]KAI5868479.1 hypothetical protein GGS23DRAFT_545756 [Durotheca rogersii]